MPYCKGGRKVHFGHKVNFTRGKSNQIFSCEELKGNPSDSTFYKHMLYKVIVAFKP